MPFGIMPVAEYPRKHRVPKKAKTAKASKAVKSYVKSAIKHMSEYKQVQGLTDLNTDGVQLARNTWILDPIAPTSLASGTADNQRVGNSVQIRSIRLNPAIVFLADSGSGGTPIDYEQQCVRVLVVQLRPNQLVTSFTTALNGFQLLDNISNNENMKSYAHVLYDKVIQRKQYATSISESGTNVNTHIGTDARTFNIIVKPKITKARWNSGTGTASPDLQGAIFVYYYYDRLGLSSGTEPSAPFYYKLGYQFNYMDM